MNPELFTIPILDWPVKSYGLMLTLGFLSGVWLSMRRAERLKADPDMIVNIGFICLICGVVGARLFYVLHYWESSFARSANPLLSALKLTSGGLEYYGGLIGAIAGAVVYMVLKRASLRLYLDILAPGAAWGLAFGRVGCLLNGCCWGGLCVDAHDPQHVVVPWAMSFPYSSSAQTRQWENRQLTVPAELIVTVPGISESFLLPKRQIDMPVEKREGPGAKVRTLEQRLRDMRALKAEAEEIRNVEAELAEAVAQRKKHEGELYALLGYAMRYPSREDSRRTMTASELSALSRRYGSLPVHPAQVYGIINALLLSWLLLELLHRRKRHGVVFAVLCTVYPLTRMILELVRVDNPHDSAGLTVSQAVSVGMFLFGVALLLYLRTLPERSPRAVAYVPPSEDQSDGKS